MEGEADGLGAAARLEKALLAALSDEWGEAPPEPAPDPFAEGADPCLLGLALLKALYHLEHRLAGAAEEHERTRAAIGERILAADEDIAQVARLDTQLLDAVRLKGKAEAKKARLAELIASRPDERKAAAERDLAAFETGGGPPGHRELVRGIEAQRAGVIAALQSLAGLLADDTREDLAALLAAQPSCPEGTVAAELDLEEQAVAAREAHAQILAAIEAARLRREIASAPPAGRPRPPARPPRWPRIARAANRAIVVASVATLIFMSAWLYFLVKERRAHDAIRIAKERKENTEFRVMNDALPRPIETEEAMSRIASGDLVIKDIVIQGPFFVVWSGSLIQIQPRMDEIDRIYAGKKIIRCALMNRENQASFIFENPTQLPRATLGVDDSYIFWRSIQIEYQDDDKTKADDYLIVKYLAQPSAKAVPAAADTGGTGREKRP